MWVELSRVYNQMSNPALGTLAGLFPIALLMWCQCSFWYRNTDLIQLNFELRFRVSLSALFVSTPFLPWHFWRSCRDHCWCWLDNERLFRGLAIFRKSRKRTSLRVLQCFWVQLPPQWVYLLFLLLMAESVWTLCGHFGSLVVIRVDLLWKASEWGLVDHFVGLTEAFGGDGFSPCSYKRRANLRRRKGSPSWPW